MVELATIADLLARWPDAPSVASTAERLHDASALVLSEMARAGVRYDADDELQAANLKAVVCQMVHRAVGDGSIVDGVANQSRTAGPYTLSYTYANPDGGLYLSSAERRLLGIKRVRLGSIEPAIRGAQ